MPEKFYQKCEETYQGMLKDLGQVLYSYSLGDIGLGNESVGLYGSYLFLFEMLIPPSSESHWNSGEGEHTLG